MVSKGKYGAKTEVVSVSSSDSLVDKGINGAIAADLAARRAEFVKNADEVVADGKGDPDGVKPDQMGQEIKCTEAAVTPLLVSIECSSSTNLGGAHPEEQRFAYTYRICAGKSPTPMTLTGACRPDVPCVKTIVAAINRRLATGPVKDANLTVNEQSGALRHFAITKAGMRFFASDELPHALQSAGTIDVPFADLKTVLRADGPMTGLVR